VTKNFEIKFLDLDLMSKRKIAREKSQRRAKIISNEAHLNMSENMNEKVLA